MFVVLSMVSAPEHLRGYTSRFLSETATGLYVGNVSKRVQKNLWQRCELAAGEGSFTMIISDRSKEQGFRVLSVGAQSRPVMEVDGVTLAYTYLPKNRKNQSRS